MTLLASVRMKSRVLPLDEDHSFTCRFAHRIVPRFRPEGAEAGQQVKVRKIDPGTGKRLGPLATATVGAGGSRGRRCAGKKDVTDAVDRMV
jgi:hypothetical protein